MVAKRGVPKRVRWILMWISGETPGMIASEDPGSYTGHDVAWAMRQAMPSLGLEPDDAMRAPACGPDQPCRWSDDRRAEVLAAVDRTYRLPEDESDAS